MSTELTRNFSIIAHIDHGKTTLSDRLMEATSTVTMRETSAQQLDSMDLEREKGITIKSHPVAMTYKAKDGKTYKLNLLDTPGHVDFTYEVSRALAACEGAILMVDAAQGVEAQTVANLHLAEQQNLKIIPVLNKIDLPAADVEKCKKQLEDILCIPAEDCIPASAKAGIGIEEILEAIVARVPAPVENPDKLLRATVFDSLYDTYRGVVSYVRVFSGTMKRGQRVRLFATDKTYEIKEVGVFTPKMSARDVLVPGDVGYVIANMKSAAEVKIGDTMTDSTHPCPEALPGYKEIQPMVFTGIYPVDSSDYEALKMAVGKLQINDPAFTFAQESSMALGFGFRCGFLGLLHMEIIQERLRREFDMDVISTYPSVIYHVDLTDGSEVIVDNPTLFPEAQVIQEIREPVVNVYIMVPGEYIGDMMQLVMEKRGEVTNTETIDDFRVMLSCVLPLAEILVDFNDKLKSMTKGYGSMDYEHAGYRSAKMVKMDMLIAGDPVEAFSTIVHRDKAESYGRVLAGKLKEVIPNHLFVVAIQAAVGGKIVARESISAMRKNVTAKCYGGDISRKRKLLEKQKAGKAKMKMFGKVNIPQDAFIKVLKNND
ncbi:MAG: translation elongation factor 4 [Akkermansiaceae bacterium]|jgi:GTP-binding protein LepA|nr:translation elongation factor 4 [Akkermansiaceae bacterium]MDP4646240.1 translation elongation factor 4 [Akkermansiaceae bacterium]MDP4720278.1 translation elongation factor 4 [Akkermansiaceae bacterium]MDP4779919.1 translation elongation factor 4 [Akkermansiaceae bacterium]MDP4845886.1 translation elongation factor 4 [Akkermansiaceae bacterium]